MADKLFECRGPAELKRVVLGRLGCPGENLVDDRRDEMRLQSSIEKRALTGLAPDGGQHLSRSGIELGIARPLHRNR